MLGETLEAGAWQMAARQQPFTRTSIHIPPTHLTSQEILAHNQADGTTQHNFKRMGMGLG
jgi:hypothetical protein